VQSSVALRPCLYASRIAAASLAPFLPRLQAVQLIDPLPPQSDIPLAYRSSSAIAWVVFVLLLLGLSRSSIRLPSVIGVPIGEVFGIDGGSEHSDCTQSITANAELVMVCASCPLLNGGGASCELGG
jgi:hypothetical protein